MRWNNFEHRLWIQFKEWQLHRSPSLLLAVSGGVDSVVLLNAVARLRPRQSFRVAHFHHGNFVLKSDDAKLLEFRNQSRLLVQHNVSTLNQTRKADYAIELVLGEAIKPLHSEAEMREARWDFFVSHSFPDKEAILTAHHLDDWVETAVLKMIRGTSLAGVSGMKSIQRLSSGVVHIRPFLRLLKSDLVDYALDQKLDYAEDPSNASPDHLRNWVRCEWLPLLEERQPGAYKNLTQSLLQMTEDFEASFTGFLGTSIDRASFIAHSEADQLRVLAAFLKQKGVHAFTRGQLQEIRKQLDKNQKDFTFSLLRRKWVINASQIMLE